MGNFIRDKLIIRPLLASVAPVALYSAGYGVARIAGLASIPYFSATPWMCLAGISLVYPVNHIGLAMLFAPIEYMLWRKLKIDATTNPMLKGNFLPVDKEDAYEVLEVSRGKVPTDINGVYLRNGPNAKYHADNGRGHFFDGDSMIHAFRIKDGRIYYCNRYTTTPRLLAETKAQGPLFIRVGELFNAAGLAKAALFGLQRKVGYKLGGDLKEHQNGTANTAFAHHQKKTYALLEADLPFNIRVDRNEKSFDIKSIGYDDFDGQLTHNVSAHPKVDRKTGELLCFGYDVRGKDGKGQVFYSLFNKDRKLLLSTAIPITTPRMIHDFIVTQNYIIIPDSPMELRPDLVIKESKFVFQFDGQKPSRYGVMKRSCQNPDQVQWFETPGHMVFHYVNAWEEKAENGDDIIRCFGCTQDSVNIDFEEEHPFLSGK